MPYLLATELAHSAIGRSPHYFLLDYLTVLLRELNFPMPRENMVEGIISFMT